MTEPSDGAPDDKRFAFLFKSDQGRISASIWRRHAARLAALLALLTVIWWVISPFAEHDLAKQAFFDPAVIATFVYLIFYAFAVLLIGICYYNLSAKRWRDRARPPSLAGLLPVAALCAGAAHWLQPRVTEVMPRFYVIGLDVLLVLILVWNIGELGFMRSRPQSGGQ